MASQHSSPWTIERLTGADSRAVLCPVFEE